MHKTCKAAQPKGRNRRAQANAVTEKDMDALCTRLLPGPEPKVLKYFLVKCSTLIAAGLVLLCSTVQLEVKHVSSTLYLRSRCPSAPRNFWQPMYAVAFVRRGLASPRQQFCTLRYGQGARLFVYLRFKQVNFLHPVSVVATSPNQNPTQCKHANQC